jgi:hypothetical protein
VLPPPPPPITSLPLDAETPAEQPDGTPAPATQGDGSAAKPATPQAAGQSAPAAAAQTAAQGATQNTAQSAAQMQQALLKRTHYGPFERFWVGGGLLLWWSETAPPPGPLVTTGPPVSGGFLGHPLTSVLYGNSRFNFGTQPGVWLEAGGWLDECHQWGLMAAWFLLERQAQGQSFTSDPTGSPLLARPFTDANTRAASSFLVSSPGTLAGSVAVTTNTQFSGWELNALRDLSHGPNWDWRVLGGFRYLDLYENLQIDQTSTTLVGAVLGPPAGTVQDLSDRFTTRNQVFLGQVGTQVEWLRGPLFLRLMGKVGLGPNHERFRNLGSTTQITPGAGTTFSQGGLLALPGTPAVPGGNFGMHSTNWFVIVPEVGLSVGVNVGQNLRLSTGYSFLYINSVVRPGGQVNPVVNPSLIPASRAFGSTSGPGQPTVSTRQDDFYVHGLRFLIELRF